MSIQVSSNFNLNSSLPLDNRTVVADITARNAIATPAEGLMIYDLTLHKLCVFTGSVWETVTSI